ncbi:MAG: histidinol-phosphate transaminase [Fibrobacter sp.]|jgi:histidinol-phosphate aminotransferase|nr:histidinol-phosphate transaminase [Fibrobacter sp.]
MNAENFAQPHLLKQPIYVTGKPIAYTAREFGLDPAQIDKLASNENPLGPSPKGIAAAAKALAEVNLYPDGGCYDLIGHIGEFRKVNRDQVVVGNGSNELLDLIAKVFLGPGTEAIMGSHGFAVYKLATLVQNATPVEIPMPAPDFNLSLAAVREAITEKTRVIFIANPNNPTGTELSAKELLDFARSIPENVVLVLDEAYTEFIEEDAPDFLPLIEEGLPIICCRTFSKIYGLAGLRCGYAITRPDIASLIHRVREPFNVNSLAQAAAQAALGDQEYVAHVRKANAEGLKQLSEGFKSLGLPYIPSRANFIVVLGVKEPTKAFEFLQKKGTIVRPQRAMGDALRVTVGTKEQNERFLRNLSDYLKSL